MPNLPGTSEHADIRLTPPSGKRAWRQVVGPASLVLLTAALLLASPRAAAAFSAASGTGAASATVAPLAPPVSVAASGSDGTGVVHVTWNASPAPDGGTVDGFLVQRLAAGIPSPACGTSSVALAEGSACDDPAVADGTYTYTVTAVFRSWTAQSLASAPVDVANLDHLTLDAPAATGAGAPFSVTVAARSASGTAITGYLGTVHFTTTDAQATLPADYTFVAGDEGSHVFAGEAALRTSGSQTVGVEDDGPSSVADTATVAVTAGPASRLRIVQHPTNTTAGATISPPVRVHVEDQYGNLTGNAIVGLAVTGEAAALNGITTQLTVGGVATFANLSITMAGAYSLTATSPGLAAATSARFAISAAAPSRMCVVATLPTCSAGILSVARGSTTTTQIRIFDSYGNVATAPSPISVTLTAYNQVGAPSPGAVTIGTGASTSGSFSVKIDSGGAKTGSVAATATGLSTTYFTLRST